MPRNDFYPYPKPCPYEKPYDYNEYDNYDAEDNYEMSYEPYAKPWHKPEHRPHHCCPCPCPPWPKPEPKPCPCRPCPPWPKPWPPKPEPKPCCPCPCPKPWPPKPEPKPCCKKLISAQLSYDDPQKVAEDYPLRFNAFDGVSTTDTNAPLYTDGTSITFKNAGRFIVHYGSDVHFEDASPVNNNDVRLALKLNGNTINPSISHGRNTDTNDDGRQTLNKSTLINVPAGAILQLVAIQNDKPYQNEFLWTNLVIDEKCE